MFFVQFLSPDGSISDQCQSAENRSGRIFMLDRPMVCDFLKSPDIISLICASCESRRWVKCGKVSVLLEAMNRVRILREEAQNRPSDALQRVGPTLTPQEQLKEAERKLSVAEEKVATCRARGAQAQSRLEELRLEQYKQNVIILDAEECIEALEKERKKASDCAAKSELMKQCEERRREMDVAKSKLDGGINSRLRQAEGNAAQAERELSRAEEEVAQAKGELEAIKKLYQPSPELKLALDWALCCALFIDFAKSEEAVEAVAAAAAIESLFRVRQDLLQQAI